MINIMFGGNYKVFDGILLCLLSTIKHTKQPLNVFVLTADLQELNIDYKPISETEIEILNQVVKEKNKHSKVTRVVLGNEFKQWIISSENKLSVYTPFAFLRLFADKLDLPEKIIYLDTDIMLNGNISTLYNYNITDYELGVVLDRYGRFFIKKDYFNSGMLLMNLKKIKETNLLEKVRIMCSTKKMPFPDQDALNKLCKNELYLPRKFNEQGNLREDTIIQHFSKRFTLVPYFHTINIKPWQVDLVHEKYKCHAYDDIYEDYFSIKNKLNETINL